MTALEYMEKQLQKHRQNFIREFDRKAPQEVLENIKLKISHYEAAVEALRNNEDDRCGHWIADKHTGICYCSECLVSGSPHWKICPVCEAKMERKENETL